ncbi:MAG: hypothetical protein JW757_12875 [Anaerolineales bacterium]|nr:hypothetical protein [Anaerolineales bacterium]
MGNQLDLLSLFGAVTGALEENKSTLNKADEYNGNHGDNMVNIFNMVTGAISDNKEGDISTQLAAAGKMLGGLDSGSAKEYAKGFGSASEQFQGGELTADSVLPLLQSMFGGGAAPQADNSLQGMLSGFLGGDDGKLDAGDLLSAGMSFLTAKNKGKNTQEALIEALIAQSAFGESPHRAKSSSLVASTIFDMLGK